MLRELVWAFIPMHTKFERIKKGSWGSLLPLGTPKIKYSQPFPSYFTVCQPDQLTRTGLGPAEKNWKQNSTASSKLIRQHKGITYPRQEVSVKESQQVKENST